MPRSPAALQRAGAPSILSPRSLASSHPALLPLLRPGTSVLDVGSGPGALTAEIARHVSPGAVVGIDVNPAMIRTAEEAHPPAGRPNLVFRLADIRQGRWRGEFSVVNAARTLQWIPEPAAALGRMADAAIPGGHVVVLDADHTATEWRDAPPQWRRFHRAFLEWRAASGLDNALAPHLSALAEAAGLTDLRVIPQVSAVRAGDADFFRAAGFWRMIADGRGRQMVAAGHVSEADRRAALAAFTSWMRRPNAMQITRDACLIARRP